MAEQFQKATEYTDDLENHSRKAKELQRKAVKVASGKASAVGAHVVGVNGYRPNGDGVDMSGLRIALPELKAKELPRQGHGHISHSTIGDSYTLLTENDEEDDLDPFNRFWEVLEKMVEKLSNPVAFASAPLSENDNPTPAWLYGSDINNVERLLDGNEEDDLRSKPHKKDTYAMMESYFVVPEKDALDTTRGTPSSAEKRTWQDYVTENEQLKKRIDLLLRKLQAMERAAEESNMLKSSILQFRNDVQKQAKRIMQSHDSSMRSSAALANSGTHTIQSSSIRYPQSGNVAELMARLKELEEENRQLRAHNEKQQLLMNKYRERWEKLKESAKKRRAQPSDQQQEKINGEASTARTRPPTLLRSLAQQPNTNQTSNPPSNTLRPTFQPTDYQS
ncbi:hypothetical protein EC973_004184 [Apophysomyces ossiformis]|uniref:Uncharacterized protein n=1 Tax=Apophysomyces ossiformis TaxID=679940 RepID=A0A8H7BT17_9FUNG|nr:hypothetical protein EC973_004184 [Apophysomyces ossiformis]